MSLAIKFGDSLDVNSISGAIYFDAVTSYSKDHSGKVTSHPIEAGASITDHFISNNPKVKISGVVSHVDFSPTAQFLYLDGTPVINQHNQPQAVKVANLGGLLKEFAPGVISQFLPTLSPDVIMDMGENVNHKDSIEMLLRQMLNGLYYSQERKRWENRMTPTTIYEVDGLTPIPVFTDFIVTNFVVNETVETGDALIFELSGEQVRFVTLEKAEAPTPAKGSATERATAEKKNKGTVPATKTTESPKATPTVLGNIGKATGISF